MKRIYGLDYLRGLSALGIMIYHYSVYAFGKFGADTFLERLGTYGVSIFYILSGLTLYYVYYKKMDINKSDVISFFQKRIFRIFPLLWLVTIVAILLSGKTPNWINLFLNLTGLFGFLRWDMYFSQGVWSIGNELVFYVFFPFFVYFTKNNKTLMVLLSAAILSIYAYFAFFGLDPNQSLVSQWSKFINPLNQVFLFLSGFLIGYFFNKSTLKSWQSISLIIVGLIIFIYYPAYGNDRMSIITGIARFAFTIICVMICFGFYKLPFAPPNFLHKPLLLLGEISYSVYLIHPIIYHIFVKYIEDKSVLIIVSSGGSFVTAYLVYTYFEKYFMKYGNKKFNILPKLRVCLKIKLEKFVRLAFMKNDNVKN